MKKNLIALAVASALVAPAVMADVDFGADARYRFAYTDNDGATSNFADNRVRIKVKASNDAGVTANARFEMDRDGGGSDNGTDYAYMTAPLGPVTLTAGDVKVKWGTGLFINSTRIEERLALTYKADAFSASLLVDEYGGGTNGAAVKGKVAGWTVGLVTKQGNSGGNDAKTWVDVYAAGNAGPVKLAIENVTKDDDQTGTVVHGIYAMGGMNIHGAFVTTADGFEANKFFGPVSIVGKDQPTAALNIGQTGDTDVILVGVDMAAGPGHAQVMAGTYDDGAAYDAEMFYDLQYKYPLGKGASIKATYGGVMDYTAFGMSLNAKF